MALKNWHKWKVPVPYYNIITDKRHSCEITEMYGRLQFIYKRIYWPIWNSEFGSTDFWNSLSHTLLPHLPCLLHESHQGWIPPLLPALSTPSNQHSPHTQTMAHTLTPHTHKSMDISEFNFHRGPLKKNTKWVWIQ